MPGDVDRAGRIRGTRTPAVGILGLRADRALRIEARSARREPRVPHRRVAGAVAIDRLRTVPCDVDPPPADDGKLPTQARTGRDRLTADAVHGDRWSERAVASSAAHVVQIAVRGLTAEVEEM